MIELNTPLLIRLLEMSREDFKTDEEIHYLVEAIEGIKAEHLTMRNYDEIMRRFAQLRVKT